MRRCSYYRMLTKGRDTHMQGGSWRGRRHDRTRSGQTLQMSRSAPIYAEVCMRLIE